ncbi:uncharacterized protein F4807DRAFT_455779 [Annulohypoxylon truncatum]|uniref:uncharacterized protein n=1 Tax=Annulohypoxylon truncatum TaxID=327061 RepID=UPI002007C144|nr:uncharacterized protein F4807DRAFT_455779 [Annulohypoxylon truncatum]KAI1214137.1 hypothetical protein F4807DRAFT_455779 [Annulohypoxylon truncatum]
MAVPRVPTLSVGNDICQISRILTILTSDAGPKFVRRVLTEDELNVERGKAILSAMASRRGVLTNPLKYSRQYDKGREEVRVSRSMMRKMEKAAQYVAGRWAAKEAVRKAYTVRRINFQDVEVKYEPQIFEEAGAAELLSQEEDVDVDVEEEEESKPGNDKWQSSLVLGNKPMYTNWGPPIAIIRGGGVYEDEYARISISHDGDYAMASCVLNMTEPRRLKDQEESDESQNEVD